MGRILGGAVALLVLVIAVLFMRDATLSTHQDVPAGSQLEVVIRSSTRGGEGIHTLSDMTRALVLTCRLEVPSTPVGPIERLDDERFRFVLQPSLDDTNRRQFRGCLTDWEIDHVKVDVLSMTELAPDERAGTDGE